jgi:cytochrome c oxidase subunit 3
VSAGTAASAGAAHTPPSPSAWAVPARAGLRALDPRRLGLWVFLATVTMLFAAFSSAYLVRMASGAWKPIDLPAILWLSTATIVLSSAAIGVARTGGGSSRAAWIAITFGLGVLFLAGQAVAWRALVAAGLFMPDSPHAAFLYIFTALHGAHLVGGLVWLAVVWRSDLRWNRVLRRAPAALEPVSGATFYVACGLDEQLARCATYWHFMGGLWVFLFAVLHLR